MKRVLVLGSTGSIGTQALDVISASENLQVAGLSADSSWETLVKQAGQHGVPAVALADPEAAERAASDWGGQVLAGEEGVRELIVRSKPDLVLNAVVGAAGLGPTIVALTEGIDLALANKESLVIGGELVMALAEATDAQIVPVDSEHSALYQLIHAEQPGTVERLVLTASGGPFRGRTDLSGISTDEALAHPTWEMGGRITIDSATLMNKGLELIEAHHLFGTPYERIDVVVHPQSIVHSMVEFIDGSTIAQASPPDMRLPISLGLDWPYRVGGVGRPIDWTVAAAWTFEPLDDAAFPAVRLAKKVGRAGGTYPAVFNAANEQAVDAFHDGRLSFPGIVELIDRVVDAHDPQATAGGTLTRESVRGRAPDPTACAGDDRHLCLESHRSP